MDIETLEKWLPYYKNFGAVLRGVPRELIPDVIRKCAQHGLECDITPEDAQFSTVIIKGVKNKASSDHPQG